MSKDITLLEEISEQDLHQANGGTDLVISVQTAENYLASHYVLGDKGYVCTATKECMGVC